MGRKLSILLILVLLVGAVMVPATAGAEEVVTDGPKATAPRFSHRLIIELTSPALAEYALNSASVAQGGGGKLDVTSASAQRYVQRLQAEQRSFITTLQRAAPGAQIATYLNEEGRAVQATYQLLLNGVAVDLGRDVDVEAAQRRLSRLAGVKHVYKDFAHDPDLYASLPLINAPVAWNNAAIGGKANAGAGIKVASMDGGLHKDAPMFDGTGYSYPPGFPIGDTRSTNGKIIASRVYFRTWDPPSAGDENPWPGTQGTEHGVHTASTAAGNEVTVSYLGAPPVTISGVAPAAWVMSYRVFYNSITNDGSFYTIEGIKALEDITADGADVLNNSWGGGPGSVGGEFDALDAALINAARSGIFVSMSAGNAGPGNGTTDHPSDDYINVAASTTTGTFAAGRLKVAAPEPVPSDLLAISYAGASFGAAIPIGTVVGPFDLLPAVVAMPTNANGCVTFPAGTFTGKAALISRGSCEFGVKALNAEHAGASFVIIHNNAGDSLTTMGPGAVGAQVTIPAIFIGQSNGVKLVNWYNANGAASQIALDTTAYQVGNTPDQIASFSSRGPGVGNVLKPDIAAPGVNILAQGFAVGAEGEARHLGFGQASGTSMAAPHITGAAALLRQIHPDWSNAWIKSALMSTAKYLGVFTHTNKPAQPLDMGAGRLDLTNAANPGVILDPPSLSFGAVTLGATKSIDVALTSVASSTETYDASTLFTGMGFGSLTTLPGVSVTPSSVTLDPGETETITVEWDSVAAMGVGDNQGYVVLTSANFEAHLPAWMRVAYQEQPVLINADLTLEAGKDYTVAAVGMASSIEPLVLTDDNTAPAAGKASVRFVHASPDAPAVDVALTGGPVLVPNVPFKGATPYMAVDAGTYDLELRATGTMTVTLFLPATEILAGKIYDVFAMGKVVGTNGTMLSAVVEVNDPSAPPAGKARVRAVHAVPDAPPVSVLVNDEVAFFGVAFKEITDYATVDAGATNVKVKPAMGDVLIVDNDGSSSLGLDDYTGYYADSLAELGVTYDVWDADENAGNTLTIPDANTLAQYKAVIYQTGDNFRPNGSFTVPTPPTSLDMNRLVEYSNNGGKVIAFGQDMASITSSTTPSSAAFFYSSLLGAEYLQDSVTGEVVFDDAPQLMTGLPNTLFSNSSFDISATGDGFGNQFYVDEIKVACNEPDTPILCRAYAPLLKYSVGGNNVGQGYVALAHRDQPSLERPGLSFMGSAAYFSFGLEGVNSDTGFNTRADLLGAALDWSLDEATASIVADVHPTGQVSYFTATMDTTHGGTGSTFRWDFGDGSNFSETYKSKTAGHTFDKPGTYQVRVEATDALGNKAIGTLEVTVESQFNTEVTQVFPAAADTYIHSGQQTTNFGTAPYLYVGGSYDGSDFIRSLVMFDLGTIPAGYPVDEAKLWVYLDSYSGGGTAAELRAYGVSKGWTETGATWKVPWTVKGGDFAEPAAGTQPISKDLVGQWIKIDVTSLAQNWVANSVLNHGLLLRLRNATSFSTFRFVAKNNWAPANAPKLEVTFRTP